MNFILKGSTAYVQELENLLVKYVGEINKNLADGYLKESTAKTYLLHANNFVKWCNGNFTLGGANMLPNPKG